MDTSDGKHAIPILWGVDAVHGHNNIIGATLFPHNVALGATRNAAAHAGDRRSHRAANCASPARNGRSPRRSRSSQDVRWGRAYESYSEDPTVVRDTRSAIVTGLQGEVGLPDFLRGDHVIATAKHFLADGGTFEGRDQGDARASEDAVARRSRRWLPAGHRLPACRR